jgi:hypothetical protein
MNRGAGPVTGKNLSVGPVQLLVIELPDEGRNAAIRDELEWLRESDTIRLVDVLLVRKDAEGNISTLETGDVAQDAADAVGAVVGALIGYGTAGERGAKAIPGGSLLRDERVWFPDDAIPNDCSVAVALIEHRWAAPLQEAITKVGGATLADAWVHASDLVAIGMLPAGDAPKATA